MWFWFMNYINLHKLVEGYSGLGYEITVVNETDTVLLLRSLHSSLGTVINSLRFFLKLWK